MTLKSYFENARGIGVLSTADREGRVDAAIYATPHFLDDGTIAFIMRDRLTHSNIQSNPYAAYLFVEREAGYKGCRLFLKKVREEADSDLLSRLRRRKGTAVSGNETEAKFLVVFQVEKQLPLVGPGRDAGE